MRRLDIIFVNWNSGNFLRDCLQTIDNSSKIDLNTLNVIIIDNNSNDNSLQIPANLRFKSQTIINDKNMGFGYACNQGLKYGNSPYVLFLNVDVKLNPTTLYDSILFMDTHDSVGVMGIKNLDESNKPMISCGQHLTFKRAFFELTGMSKLFPKYLDNGPHLNKWDYNKSGYVDHVIGAYYFSRRTILEKLNCFDERFFVYLEDLDLSYRIKKSGQKIFYNSNISVMHYGGGTTRSVKGFSLYLSLQSRILYAYKHWPKYQSLLYKFLLLTIGFLVRLFVSILKFNKREIKDVLKAHKLLLKSQVSIPLRTSAI